MFKGIIEAKIQAALENVADELNVNGIQDFHKDFFITIAPQNAEYDFKFFIWQRVDGKTQKIRELKLEEII